MCNETKNKNKNKKNKNKKKNERKKNKEEESIRYDVISTFSMATSDTQSPVPQMAAMFACELCPLAFDNPGHLDRHRQVHAEQAAAPAEQANVEQANAVEQANVEQANVERANVERASVERTNARRANAERANAGRNRNVCPHCHGRFTTSDVLQRHMDAYHSAGADGGANSKGPCQRCLRFKLKCDGASPCGWCIADAGPEHCVAPETAAAPAPAPTPAPVQAPAPSSASASASGSHAARTASASPRRRRRRRAQRGRSTGSSSPRAMVLQPVPPSRSRQSSASGLLSLDGGSSSPRGSEDGYVDYAVPQPLVPGEVNLQRVSLGWLDFEVACVRRYGAGGPIVGGGDGNAAAAPGQHSSSSPRPGDAGAPLLRRLPWLPQAAAAPGSSNYESGSLAMAMDSLGLLFKEPRVPRAAELVGSRLQLLPGIELLRQLVDNYFLKWQKVQPVFHAATWKFNECPMGLLGVMACIGSVVAEDEEVAHQARQISSLCISELNTMVTALPERGPDVMYLAALCLHQTYLLGSGDGQVHQNVDRIRAYLLSGLMLWNMLRRGAGGQRSTAQIFDETSQPVHAQWLAWAARERAIRITWMVFEYDCNVAILGSRPYAIDLEHLPRRFPCAEALYDAPDAQAWAELRSRSPYGAQGPLVASVMAVAGTGGSLSEHISSWSKRLCTQMFERILRGILWPGSLSRTIEAAKEFGVKVTSGSVEDKASLLWSISFLGKSIHDGASTVPLSSMDLVNFTSTKLMRHYNHFIVYPHIMDLIIYIARTAASPSSPGSRTTLRWAQRKLVEAFAADPYHSRQYLWHAGQMIRAAQVYTVFAPGDSMRVFSAYLAILAFCKYGPPSLRDVSATDPFRADVWAYCDSGVERWLQTGGPCHIGSFTRIQARCSTEQLMQDAYKMLCRLENWGISERFFNILIHFNDLDVLNE
ncbi:hypothetical protein Trco_003667 [Trichoderma cornu-damae]|uniref:C2H2-type domain-containing protein n=1 Tax=Trichoderma cornu-damae TaxID=654480 RepID=A0A9P8TW73_9HYPO|nr:hypothetical protein Trco_003667 [Trichoderma cornu-damae]